MTSGATNLSRLTPERLHQVRAGTRLPGYDRNRLDIGIVHLGLGAFVRAHVASFTDDVLEIDFGAWGIAGVSLQKPGQRDRLAPQSGLYTALERDGGGVRARIIGCVKTLHVAPENPAAVIALLTSRACRIVSLTITEKGYCHDPASGRLDAMHPDIVHDLEHPTAPRSAAGLITAALGQRRSSGAAPFTILCCDNLPHNGQLLAGLVRDFAALRDDRLASWIETHVAFPSTMVDRIVPAGTEADVVSARAAIGFDDAAPVSHEPFRQWVIEDRFVDGRRPAWERAGAELVANVAPYELMKLRLLNGAHSALAYLGYLAGYETIADAVGNAAFSAYIDRLWADEIIPVVPAPSGVDLTSYTAQLRARFANTAIKHRTWQIASDGSQKLPPRLLATIRERLTRGLPFPRLALAVAAWIRYVSAIDEAGRPIDVRDPFAETLRATFTVAGSDAIRQVAAIIALQPVFGADLPRSHEFVAAVTEAYCGLIAKGAHASVASVTAD